MKEYDKILAEVCVLPFKVQQQPLVVKKNCSYAHRHTIRILISYITSMVTPPGEKSGHAPSGYACS